MKEKVMTLKQAYEIMRRCELKQIKGIPTPNSEEEINTAQIMILAFLHEFLKLPQ